MGKGIYYFLLIFGLSGTMLFGPVKAQVSNPEAIKAMIARYKTDPRGPYEDIRWYCKDGTLRAARDPCPNAPGNQRARYKAEVQALADKEHIFLGQILATIPFPGAIPTSLLGNQPLGGGIVIRAQEQVAVVIRTEKEHVIAVLGRLEPGAQPLAVIVGEIRLVEHGNKS